MLSSSIIPQKVISCALQISGRQLHADFHVADGASDYAWADVNASSVPRLAHKQNSIVTYTSISIQKSYRDLHSFLPRSIVHRDHFVASKLCPTQLHIHLQRFTTSQHRIVFNAEFAPTDSFNTIVFFAQSFTNFQVKFTSLLTNCDHLRPRSLWLGSFFNSPKGLLGRQRLGPDSYFKPMHKHPNLPVTHKMDHL